MRFIAGCLAGVAATGLAGLLYVQTGAFNVAAAAPHTPLTYWVTKTVMVRSVKLRARGIAAPARFTEAQVLAGFREYDAHCVMCHGAPNIAARPPWVDGMTPPPPYLIDVARQWTPAELFWIIRNGVKMTGMPAWDRERSDQDVWNMVAFLEALPKMDSMGYARMRAASAAPPGIAGPCRPAAFADPAMCARSAGDLAPERRP